MRLGADQDEQGAGGVIGDRLAVRAVDVDRLQVIVALRAGESEASLLRRKTDLPVPEVKGSIAA